MAVTWVLGLVALASAPLAHAEGWDASFPSDAVASYLPASPTKVIVVRAGAASDDLSSASTALQAALRKSGRAPLVMDDSALGAVAGLDDQAIVKKCASMPVDAVATLRLFPDASGKLGTAVVTLYDLKGQTLSAITAQKGTALVAKNDASGGLGVSGQAAASVAQSIKQTKAASNDAEEQYERQFVGFEDWASVDANSGRVMNTWSQPFQGKYKRPLEVEEFYNVVGRPDLAQQYHSKQRTNSLLGLGGLAIGTAGLVVGTLVLVNVIDVCNVGTALESDCQGDKLLNGLGIMGIGGLLALVPFFAMSNPNPVTPDQARELADNYNKGLKKKLGLTSDQAASAPAPSAASSLLASISVAPYANAHGGGLALHLAF